MTPHENKIVELSIQNLHRIIKKNNGRLILIQSTTNTDIYPATDNVIFSLLGQKQELVKALTDSCQSSSSLSSIVRQSALKIDLKKIKSSNPTPDKNRVEDITSHLDQLLDMQESYPEIADHLRVFVNHLKGLHNCITQKQK